MGTQYHFYLENQVCSVFTVYHFYLENQVCSVLTVYHFYLENQVCSVLTVYHFYLVNQVCSVFTVYHFYLENQVCSVFTVYHFCLENQVCSKPGVFSCNCLPLLPWKPGVFTTRCVQLLLSTTSTSKKRVWSIFTEVYHFYLRNQVWPVFTDVCHFHFKKAGFISFYWCLPFPPQKLDVINFYWCLPSPPWKPGWMCFLPHSILDADLCCAGIAVWTIRGWNWGVLSLTVHLILTHAVQVSLCGPSEDELRCTQSHSTVGSGLCCAGIAVRAIRGWNWGVLNVLSHIVPVMLTYVVQVSLCVPSEGGTEVYSMYSVTQYLWCWLMLCRYRCTCHQRVELRCT